MEPDGDRHLTGADIERLMGASALTQDSRLDEFKAHLKECGRCGLLMERYQVQSDRLKALKPDARARTGLACPDSARWLDVAAGVEPESEPLLDHAAECDACGALLKVALEDLNSEEIPPEAGDVLRSGRAERIALETWRRGTGPEAARRRSPRLRWILAGAMAAAVVLLIGRSLPIWKSDPERLIAQAYEFKRTWPIRFPGAAYVPQSPVDRAAGPANTRLIEAEAMISRGLDKAPNDGRWLELRGRLDILRHSYDTAITTLQAQAQAPNPPAQVLRDLGIAHLARGSADQNASDYEAAIDYLGRALQKEPADGVALFNRALGLQSLFLWERAAEDWRAFLRLDPDSGWAQEARRHLLETQEKKTPGGAG